MCFLYSDKSVLYWKICLLGVIGESKRRNICPLLIISENVPLTEVKLCSCERERVANVFNIPIFSVYFMVSQRHRQRHWGFVPLFGCRAEVRAEPPFFEEVQWRSHLRRLTQSAYINKREGHGHFSLSHVWVSLTAESAAALLWDR